MINLASLIYASQSDALLTVYLQVNDAAFAKNEAKTLGEAKILTHLANKLLNIEAFTMSKQAGYILNFSCTYLVREEFDVLRFSENVVLNIELKRQFPKEGHILKQLLRHKQVLDSLGKSTVLCTYVDTTEELFLLANGRLKKIEIADLVTLIADDYSFINPLVTLRPPDKYLSKINDKSVIKLGHKQIKLPPQ